MDNRLATRHTSAAAAFLLKVQTPHAAATSTQQPTTRVALCIIRSLQNQKKAVLTLVEETEEVAVTSVGTARALRTGTCATATALPIHSWQAHLYVPATAVPYRADLPAAAAAPGPHWG